MNRDFPKHFGNGGHALGRKNFFRLETESRVQRQVGILIVTVESYPIKAGEICFRSSN